MNKKEFLDGLMEALAGEVSDQQIRINIDYYNTYIIEEVGKGRTEQEVLQELGDPRLIARTIIDTSGYSKHTDAVYSDYAEEQNEEKKGFHAEYSSEDGFDVRYGKFRFNTWYGKLLILLIVLCVIFLVISIVTSVVSLLLPLIVPVLIILVVLSIVNSSRR